MPRAGSHCNLGTSRGPDKIGSRAGPGPRAVSCTWLYYKKLWIWIMVEATSVLPQFRPGIYLRALLGAR